MAKRSRKNHRLEIYSQKYYETRFKDHVDQEVADTKPSNETPKEYQKRKMIIYRKWRLLSWQKECDEVKAEVEVLWNKINDAPDGVSGDNKDAEGKLDPDRTEDPDAQVGGYGGY